MRNIGTFLDEVGKDFLDAEAKFDAFLKALQELRIPGLVIHDREKDESAQFRFTYLGGRYVLRLSMSVVEDQWTVAKIDSFRVDELDGRYVPKKKVFLGVDGNVLLGPTTAIEAEDPNYNASLFYWLVRDSITSTDITSVTGFTRVSASLVT
jgi:hypothetical protein